MLRSSTPVRILFERCAAADEAAWCELLRRFGPQVRRAVVRVLGPRACPAEIEDFTQEVYCGLLAQNGRRLRAFRGDNAFEANRFLARTAERLARDLARIEGRRGRPGWGAWTLLYFADDHTVVDSRPGPEARALGSERRRLVVQGCRAVLQENLAARVVELALFDGWASRELARASRGRFTPGCINTLLSRARQRLAPLGLRLPHRVGLRSAMASRAA